MELFAKANAIIREDGSDRIDIPVVTPEYIDNQIRMIEIVGQLNVDEVIKVIRDSKNSFEAQRNLVSNFALEESVAEFVLEMELGKMDKYMNNAEFQKKEIAKWKALKEIISADDLAE